MGVQRKRRRREEREEEEEARREREVAREPTPADRVLELQKTAGNRAVGAALDRWALPWVPERAGSATAEWPKESVVIVDGTVIPMVSFSLASAGGGAGSSGTGRGKAAPDVDVTVTTNVGEHSSDLAERAARGKQFKKVLIVVPHKDGTGVTITLTDVLISGYQLSGTMETFTMNFSKREFSEAPPPAQP